MPKHKDVYIVNSRIPVGPVPCSAQDRSYRKQLENQYGPMSQGQVHTWQRIFGAVLGWNPCHSRRHRISQFVEADSLHQQRHGAATPGLCVAKFHTFTKVLLHNREIWLTLTESLKFSSFHEKKTSKHFSFFKLFSFRDFCKFNRLKIKCLTA